MKNNPSEKKIYISRFMLLLVFLCNSAGLYWSVPAIFDERLRCSLFPGQPYAYILFAVIFLAGVLFFLLYLRYLFNPVLLIDSKGIRFLKTSFRFTNIKKFGDTRLFWSDLNKITYSKGFPGRRTIYLDALQIDRKREIPSAMEFLIYNEVSISPAILNMSAKRLLKLFSSFYSGLIIERKKLKEE